MTDLTFQARCVRDDGAEHISAVPHSSLIFSSRHYKASTRLHQQFKMSVNKASCLSVLLAAAAHAAPRHVLGRDVASNTQSFGGPTPAAGYQSALYSSASAQLSSLMSASVTPAPASGGSQATTFGPDSQVPASPVVPSMAAYPIISSQVTGVTSHGPYSGEATTTGAVQSGPAAKSVPALGPNPTETYYNTNGQLTKEEPAPYMPAGNAVE